MTKDIGIVLLPNDECKNLSLYLTLGIEERLSGSKKLENNPHITLLHIANQNEIQENFIKIAFKKFYDLMPNSQINLPFKATQATGGSKDLGYKWADLQFQTLDILNNLRESVLDQFCFFHNGILTRMHDDMDKFTLEQLSQIEKCGIVTHPYTPHITLWYIDIPNENKSTELEEIISSFQGGIENLNCYADSIALVELGRNGNAFKIIEQYSLFSENHIDL